MLHMGDKRRSSWHQDAHWRITSSRETQAEKTTNKAHASSSQSKTLKAAKKSACFFESIQNPNETARFIFAEK
jgi:hypothetical protein